MVQSTIEKQQQSVLKAQERLGRALAKKEEKTSKLREGRMIRLGVLAEQMFKAGDLQLLGRFETVALEQFAKGKFDRLAFELDQPLNWFDKVREDAMLAKAQQAEPTKAGSSAASASGAASSASRPAGAPAASSKPSTNGAGGSSGTSVPAAPSSTASA
jgi:hypothetical protein